MTDRIRNNTVDSERRHQQGRESEEAGQQGANALERQRAAHYIPHRLNIVNRLAGVDPLDRLADLWYKRTLRPCGAYHKMHPMQRKDRIREIDLRLRRLPEPLVAGVRHHAGDLYAI